MIITESVQQMESEAAKPPAKPLSKREAQVMQFVGEGKRSQEIADALFVSKRTVDSHLANIYEKLKVQNRIEALKVLADAEERLKKEQGNGKRAKNRR